MGQTKIKIIGEEPEKQTIDDGKLKVVVDDGKIEDRKKINLQSSIIKKPSSTLNHPSSPKKHSKKYQEARSKVDPAQKYSLMEAVKLVAETSFTKFPGTIEAHLNTDVKNLRGLVSLPHFTGKKLVILAFPSPPAGGKGQIAANLGNDVMIGNDETISQIEKGKINFDVLVTTPAWMPKLAKIAKILGPKGLMPNPKNGTITENLAKTIAELQGGKVEYKTEKDGKVIHLPVGKVNQAPEEVTVNIKTLFNTIGKSKISKITLSSTMGPGVKVDLGSI